MKSVCNNFNEFEIKSSKFISLLYYINNIDEINFYLENAKLKYKNATHYCYAYIVNNRNKCSDDGEPSGTAGMPILNVLEKNNLNNVLCIVIRYFGGIKLGTGGLVRAYAKSTVDVLKNSIVNLKKGYNITIKFDYNISKDVDYLLKNTSIISKQYNDIITYNLNIDFDTYNNLKNIKSINIIINNDIYL